MILNQAALKNYFLFSPFLLKYKEVHILYTTLKKLIISNRKQICISPHDKYLSAKLSGAKVVRTAKESWERPNAQKGAGITYCGPVCSFAGQKGWG